MRSDKRRWVIVTGAGSGIGRAFVAQALEAGLGVVACVRQPSRAGGLEEAEGLRVVKVDVRRDRDVARLVKSVARLELAGVVNCAGLAFAAPLEWTTAADLSTLLEVNVVGVQRVTKALVPQLRRSKGRVINVSSGAGLITSPFTAAYSASKFALESLSDGWRMELAGDGVFVTLIEPGPVQTPIWDRVDEQRARLRRSAPASSRRHWEQRWAHAVSVLAQARATAVSAQSVATQVMGALTSERPPARISSVSREELVELLMLDEAERDRRVSSPWGL